ncbi:unnamed protein product [Blepharisma stoltei]|uniref:Tetratricopeptide repeat protein n=1 Tax=Blepharisma stoltei TaxID=1481888 RepID=A0AAU9J4V8_9CILI|nr:unnamed protein product [Blepharisma stoltei]
MVEEAKIQPQEEISPEEKILEHISKAEAFKIEGNELFKQGNYKDALKKYAKVFLYTEGLISKSGALSQYAKVCLTDQQEAQVNEIRFSTYSNMTAVHLKEGNYERTILKANKALEINESSKVLYRRGMAYLQLNDLDRAKSDFDKANEKTPGDPSIQAAYKLWNKKMKESEERDRRHFKGMFERMNLEN